MTDDSNGYREMLRRVSDAIFEKDGLKDEVARLRQAVKLATWVAGTICTLMVADFAHRIYSTQPADVQLRVRALEETQSNHFNRLERLVTKIAEEKD